MADVGTQNTHPLPESAFPVAGAPWNAHVPQSQAPPPPHQRPVPIQPRVHGIEPQNAVVRNGIVTSHYKHSCVFYQFPPANDVGDRRPDGDWEDIPPPVGNIAERGQPQVLGYNGMGYYDLAYYPPLAPPPPAVSSIKPCDIPLRSRHSHCSGPCGPTWTS